MTWFALLAYAYYTGKQSVDKEKHIKVGFMMALDDHHTFVDPQMDTEMAQKLWEESVAKRKMNERAEQYKRRAVDEET